jgi:hypothetical protein
MRQGSGNFKFDKLAWWHALQEASGGQVSQGVCNQESGEQFDLKNSTILENAEMHCIEPMPMTVKALQQASQQLQYDTTGFLLTHTCRYCWSVRDWLVMLRVPYAQGKK